MTIFQDGEGTYISMEDYIRAMLVKLQMTHCASGRRIRTPMRKAIDDFTEVSREERAFFMSACGMIGWLASTGRPDLKHCHSRARQDWVQALRDATLVKLAKVHTSDNLADLGTKLLELARHL